MVISLRVYKGTQSWNFEKIVKLNDGQKLRVFIKRDAYDPQSRAYVERWDGSDWKFVYGKTINECACYRISYVQDNVDAIDFTVDFTDLMSMARKIVC